MSCSELLQKDKHQFRLSTKTEKSDQYDLYPEEAGELHATLDCGNNPQPLPWLKIIRLVYTLKAYIPYLKWWSISSSYLPLQFVSPLCFSFIKVSFFIFFWKSFWNIPLMRILIRYNFPGLSVSYSNVHISRPHNAALIFPYWLFSSAGCFLGRLAGGWGCTKLEQGGEEFFLLLYFVFFVFPAPSRLELVF